ncbi:LOW QUALITY PROTEIN: nuclear transcription factor Y subunit C-1 [Ananas comosus]|uniref:LOW QUALITY PROTEIN: nuclear transcription factor Y subunit C-1 n=1 Tax=Ananas comosus TaxID=4615 RepID=A0A6P5GGC8_ANACO|nr:LOW QUALITY PROTEIN: nuclear transcription factor Y subunit C-1 [Ananas comosus]
MENQGPPPPPPYPPQSAAAAEHACAGAGQQQQQLQMFWSYQRQEMMSSALAASDFKNHQLPLARIKKIMKADEDVRMISAEAPVLFAKACELFILELTIRSWLHAEENKRRTLQRNDIAAAITRTDVFDFLVDIVPRPGPDDPPPKDDADAAAAAAAAASHALSPVGFVGAGLAAAAAPGVPYYYPPPQGMMIGQPAVPGIDPTAYAHRPAAGAPGTAQGWPPVWPPGAAEDGGYGRGQEVYVGHSPTNTTTSAATPPPGS